MVKNLITKLFIATLPLITCFCGAPQKTDITLNVGIPVKNPTQNLVKQFQRELSFFQVGSDFCIQRSFYAGFRVGGQDSGIVLNPVQVLTDYVSTADDTDWSNDGTAANPEYAASEWLRTRSQLAGPIVLQVPVGQRVDVGFFGIFYSPSNANANTGSGSDCAIMSGSIPLRSFTVQGTIDNIFNGSGTVSLPVRVLQTIPTSPATQYPATSLRGFMEIKNTSPTASNTPIITMFRYLNYGEAILKHEVSIPQNGYAYIPSSGRSLTVNFNDGTEINVPLNDIQNSLSTFTGSTGTASIQIRRF